ncbi:group III truncated hemoglobin [Pseudahrensia aquimaris]|uniref:Group III truncated hemoglobin n=1 Tax=Pseudahrensia aquimaris TaxID=744461 RepID=A0ABW3FAH7_9HYPH
MSNDPDHGISVRPAVERHSVHPSITAVQISDLVEGFYADILQHPRLAQIFRINVEGEWNSHLDKMKSFWRSVLLRSGEYKGKPVPAHQKIDGLTINDFQQWLSLFEITANQTFAAEAVPPVMEAAKRIASSLWLSRSNDIFAKPPTWSHTKPNSVKGTSHGHS